MVSERKVPSEPDDIVALLSSIGEAYGRIGIEAGPLSQWLVNGQDGRAADRQHVLGLRRGSSQTAKRSTASGSMLSALRNLFP